MNTDELVGEEDIEAALEAPPGRPRSRAGSSSRGDSGNGSKARSATPPEGKQAAASLLRSESLMSARERNKLKRKAKALGRQESAKPGGLDAKGRVSGCSNMIYRTCKGCMLQLQLLVCTCQTALAATCGVQGSIKDALLLLLCVRLHCRLLS
jgi:hypothetical protein